MTRAIALLLHGGHSIAAAAAAGGTETNDAAAAAASAPDSAATDDTAAAAGGQAAQVALKAIASILAGLVAHPDDEKRRCVQDIPSRLPVICGVIYACFVQPHVNMGVSPPLLLLVCADEIQKNEVNNSKEEHSKYMPYKKRTNRRLPVYRSCACLDSTIRLHNERFYGDVGRWRGGKECLYAAGFKIVHRLVGVHIAHIALP